MKAGCIREAGELCILAILTGMAKCWSRRFLFNTASKYRCGWLILDALFLTTLLKDRHPRVFFSKIYEIHATWCFWSFVCWKATAGQEASKGSRRGLSCMVTDPSCKGPAVTLYHYMNCPQRQKC